MMTSLSGLSPRFRPLAVEFLARLTESRIPVLIINTLRTPQEQQQLIAAGKSWTEHSKHLTGDAMDVCPLASFVLHGAQKLQWDASDPVWESIATLAEQLGMTSGYRWTQKDCGHVEWKG